MPHLTSIALLVFLAPLLGFLHQAFLRKLFFPGPAPRDQGRSAIVPVVMMLISAALSWYVFLRVIVGEADPQFCQAWTFTWFSAGENAALDLGIVVDNTSATILMMVATIAAMIHLFSYGYMRELDGEPEDNHFLAALPAAKKAGLTRDELRKKAAVVYCRFFALISIFTAAMIGLVISASLLGLFVCWEVMGFCSFALIAFYFYKDSARYAGVKAFMTTRIGDVAMFIGMMIIFAVGGTFLFVGNAEGELADSETGKGFAYAGEGSLFTQLGNAVANDDAQIAHDEAAADAATAADDDDAVATEGEEIPTPFSVPFPESGTLPYWLLTLAGILVFLGAVGKSAQFPLHVWLPDAMEGPTPVSALIHAATMVSAGVFLTARMMPLFTPEVMTVIALVGGFTALFSASIAIVQNDIKKVLAYSTISQLGYMMLAIGVGAYTAAIFHLLTHAFFKGLMFLGSGSVIHALHHEQDMTKMGGLARKMPWTFLTFLAGTIAIAGVPGFSGFYSKEAILTAAFHDGQTNLPILFAFAMGALAAGITAYYMFRLVFKTFFGKPRHWNKYNRARESRWVMTIPLIVLAFFAVVIGWPIGHDLASDAGDGGLLSFMSQPAMALPFTVVVVLLFFIGWLVWRERAFELSPTKPGQGGGGHGQGDDHGGDQGHGDDPGHEAAHAGGSGHEHDHPGDWDPWTDEGSPDIPHHYEEPGTVPSGFKSVAVWPFLAGLLLLAAVAIGASQAHILELLGLGDHGSVTETAHADADVGDDEHAATEAGEHEVSTGVEGWFGELIVLPEYNAAVAHVAAIEHEQAEADAHAAAVAADAEHPGALASADEEALAEPHDEDGGEHTEHVEGAESESLVPGMPVFDHGQSHLLVMFMSLTVAAIGIGLAWYFVVGPKAGVDFAGFTGVLGSLRRLLAGAYYIDTLYRRLFIDTLNAVKSAVAFLDLLIIDGLVNLAGKVGRWFGFAVAFLDWDGVDGAVRGASQTILGAGQVVRRAHTGRIQDYVFLFVLTIIVLAAIFLLITAL